MCLVFRRCVSLLFCHVVRFVYSSSVLALRVGPFPYNALAAGPLENKILESCNGNFNFLFNTLIENLKMKVPKPFVFVYCLPPPSTKRAPSKNTSTYKPAPPKKKQQAQEPQNLQEHKVILDRWKILSGI